MIKAFDQKSIKKRLSTYWGKFTHKQKFIKSENKYFKSNHQIKNFKTEGFSLERLLKFFALLGWRMDIKLTK